MFKRELRALARIKHQGVVQLIGIGKDPNDEFVFVVLEKCDSSGWKYVQEVFSQLTEFPKDIILSWA